MFYGSLFFGSIVNPSVIMISTGLSSHCPRGGILGIGAIFFHSYTMSPIFGDYVQNYSRLTPATL